MILLIIMFTNKGTMIIVTIIVKCQYIKVGSFVDDLHPSFLNYVLQQLLLYSVMLRANLHKVHNKKLEILKV